VNHARALQAFSEFKFFLNRGEIRAAEKSGGTWKVNLWVKKGIILGFRLGALTEYSINRQFPFFDKSTFPLKGLTLDDGVRLVPGGSSIRDGVYVAHGVVCMPPMYVNTGAHIEEGCMVDSHVLIGSCAQIGKRVHIGAGSQIGGVLEPVVDLPVIVEDDVFIGGNCGVYDGTIVQRGAVLGAGVILTASTPVYDCVREAIYRKESGNALVIPDRAVVVPGSRPIASSWARSMNLSVATPVIIKYRDQHTDAAAALEESLH
jgi:2,3,4,5-tetrahydropyridine-2-carboxylate N-succinyltransferase